MSPLPPLGFFAHGAAITGDYQAIMTATVDSGGASSITFSSIPSTFKHLQIRYIGLGSTNGNPIFRFNGDTGSNSDYTWHVLYGNGSNALAAAGAPTTFSYLGNINASAPDAGVIDILDYADTNKYKTTRLLAGTDTNGGGEVGLFSGVYMKTNAISSITFSFTNFTQYTQFALYGIKGA